MGVSISVMCVKNEDYRRRSEQVSEIAESEKERVREKEKEKKKKKERERERDAATKEKTIKINKFALVSNQ